MVLAVPAAEMRRVDALLPSVDCDAPDVITLPPVIRKVALQILRQLRDPDADVERELFERADVRRDELEWVCDMMDPPISKSGTKKTLIDNLMSAKISAARLSPSHLWRLPVTATSGKLPDAQRDPER